MDLGTLGGDSGFAYALSESGIVAGQTQTAGNAASHAFVWNDGNIVDLGTLTPDGSGNSGAYAVNSVGQVVGFSQTATAPNYSAFLWEHGSLVDLNNLIDNPPASGIHLVYAYAIAESGEILAFGVLPNGSDAVVVLTPDGICNSTCTAAAGLTGYTPLGSTN